MFEIWNFAMIVHTFPPLNFRVTKFLIFTFVYSFFDRKERIQRNSPRSISVHYLSVISHWLKFQTRAAHSNNEISSHQFRKQQIFTAIGAGRG